MKQLSQNKVRLPVLACCLAMGACSKADFFGTTGLFSSEKESNLERGVVVPQAQTSNPSKETFPVKIPGKSRPGAYTLVVADNSVGMASLIEKVEAGFQSVPAERFNDSDRIAVQRTLYLNDQYTDFAYLGFFTKTYPNMMFEPGILSLVDQASIAAFRAKIPDTTSTLEQIIQAIETNPNASQAQKDQAKANRLFLDRLKTAYDIDGPAEPWFHPKATSSGGQSYLKATLQNAYYPVGLEAGIHAFHQTLKKRSETQGLPPLSNGLFLNIVFVSDEAHPGCTRSGNLCKELISSCPTLAGIKQLLAANGVTQFRLHGVITKSDGEITPTDDGACSYRKLVQESGGTILDIEQAPPAAYGDLFEGVFAVTTPNDFPLEITTRESLDKLDKVLVDDSPASAIQVLGDHNIRVTVPKESKQVEIHFR